VIAFIGEHKDSTAGGLRWGVEPMCAVLAEHGIEISPSTYYEWAAKTPTARQRRDEQIVAVMTRYRAAKPLVAALGSRKMWLYLRGKGHDVARCTIERLYRDQGWEGARYGKTPRTTIPDPGRQRPPDLVHRRFFAPTPNRLRVADFTQVATWTGTVYIAFVIDAYSRRIVGWRAAASMTTALVLDALEHGRPALPGEGRPSQRTADAVRATARLGAPAGGRGRPVRPLRPPEHRGNPYLRACQGVRGGRRVDDDRLGQPQPPFLDT
jgi:putative transposase